MPYVFSGKVVKKGDLCEIFGVSRPTVDYWLKNGCPYEQEGGRGRAWQFNTADVFDWRLDQVRGEYEAPKKDSNVVSLQVARRDKLQAEAEKAQLEVHKMRGEVISIELLEQQLATVIGRVKSQLLALPHKLAHKAAGMKRQRDVELLLKTEITQALNDLSTFEPEPDADIDEINRQ